MSDGKVNVRGGVNGEWIATRQGWQYEGGTGYFVTVSKKCGYDVLVQKIKKKLNIDGSRNEIELTVSFNARGPSSPVIDDDDVAGVISEILINSNTILCVNIIPKVAELTAQADNRGKTVIAKANAEEAYDEEENDAEAHDDEENDETTHYDGPEPVEELDEVDEIGDVMPVLDDGNITRPRFKAMVDHEMLAKKRLESKAKWRGRCILPPHVMDEINNKSGETNTDEIDEGICVGRTYASKSALYSVLSVDALMNNYQFKTYKSEPSFVVYVCHEGKDNCEWRLRAKLVRGEGTTMEVSKFKSVHTCIPRSIQSNYHRQTKPSVLGELYADDVASSGGIFKARSLQRNVKKKYGVDITYQKAYRSRVRAVEIVQGSAEQSYGLLPSYFYMLKKNNPGTICDISVDENGAFLYCYFCLGVSLQGFSACRPLICVDATHLKNHYRGHLICAIALDADNHLYPLAFGIVDSENDCSYMYFMTWLKTSIGDVEGLVFISDQHPSIRTSLQNCFPNAHHGICYYHLKGNVKEKFKKEPCVADLRDAAYAYTESSFWLSFNKIKVKNSKLANKLQKIGFDRWSRAFFPGMRYAAITSNYCESFNSNLRDARKWTVTALVEYIRCVLRKWHYERREEAAAMTKILAPKMDKRLENAIENGKYLTVDSISRFEFDVRGNNTTKQRVDLEKRTCSCKMFDIDGIPCKHAVAAIMHRAGGKYEFCSWYFTVDSLRETYAGKVYSCGDVSEWIIPDHVKQFKVGVPVPRPSAGRPKKSRGRLHDKRIPSQGEREQSRNTCGKCKQPGHNQRTCSWSPFTTRVVV